VYKVRKEARFAWRAFHSSPLEPSMDANSMGPSPFRLDLPDARNRCAQIKQALGWTKPEGHGAGRHPFPPLKGATSEMVHRFWRP